MGCEWMYDVKRDISDVVSVWGVHFRYLDRLASRGQMGSTWLCN